MHFSLWSTATFILENLWFWSEIPRNFIFSYNSTKKIKFSGNSGNSENSGNFSHHFREIFVRENFVFGKFSQLVFREIFVSGNYFRENFGAPFWPSFCRRSGSAIRYLYLFLLWNDFGMITHRKSDSRDFHLYRAYTKTRWGVLFILILLYLWFHWLFSSTLFAFFWTMLSVRRPKKSALAACEIKYMTKICIFISICVYEGQIWCLTRFKWTQFIARFVLNLIAMW